VRIARFRECRDLVRECEMFVKNEAKVTSRVSGVKRRVMYFSKISINQSDICAWLKLHYFVLLWIRCAAGFTASCRL